MSKIDAPKFLYCHNPMVDTGHGFVLHTGTPLILAKIEAFDDVLTCGEFMQKVVVGGSTSHGDKHYVLQAVFVALGDQPLDADKLAKVMRRMADWWLAYLKNGA